MRFLIKGKIKTPVGIRSIREVVSGSSLNEARDKYLHSLRVRYGSVEWIEGPVVSRISG